MMSAASHDTLEIALFPLATVLFPEGLMPLRIFEQRYMDMAKACLKHDLPFGICLIEHGQEVGAPATPYMMGTLARISEWDMPQLGVLHVVARGGQSFLIRERWSEASGLQRALITLVPEESPRPLPDAFARLIPLLKRIYAEQGKNAYPLPHRLDDAVWLAWRFCELMPVPAAIKQEYLEMESALDRLEEIYRFCADRGLLET